MMLWTLQQAGGPGTNFLPQFEARKQAAGIQEPVQPIQEEEGGSDPLTDDRRTRVATATNI